MKVLLIGGGGREHALAWKISQSPLCKELFLAPGNCLSAALGKVVDIPSNDLVALKHFAKKEKIDLTVVGPEVPLVEGIVDLFEADGLKIFGPCKAAAQLEGSKSFSKEFMKHNGIPTAEYQVVNSIEEARALISRLGVPVVIKADGLAEGKGAFVCRELAEAESALHAIFAEKRFGAAGMKVVVEEFLAGEEASLFVLTDGNTIIPLLPAQDHKAAFDGDQGPNTGGMGAYVPAPLVTEGVLDRVLKDIVVPVIHGMNKNQTPYRGLLYVGLMIKGGVPKVVEFNCRFGDPETQPLMTLLKSDLLQYMWEIANHKLLDSEHGLEWHSGAAIGVVMASGGYPGKYETGKLIRGLWDLSDQVIPFAAGMTGKLESLKTNGGRVLCLTSRGKDLAEAREKLYAEIDKVEFEGAFYRTDIGAKGLSAK